MLAVIILSAIVYLAFHLGAGRPFYRCRKAGRTPGGSPRRSRRLTGPPARFSALLGYASDEKHATVRLLGRRPRPHPGGRPAAARSPLRALPRRRPGRSAAVVEGHLVAVGVGERESAAERPVDGR
jgi:hypothetical protein